MVRWPQRQMRELHFQVASMHRDGTRLFVGGRNCRDGIALGDVLAAPDGDVRVEGILTYRHCLNTLDSGLTGELELRGEGVESIAPNSNLYGRSERDLPALELLGRGEPHVKPV
jgi:hypothetical protein